MMIRLQKSRITDLTQKEFAVNILALVVGTAALVPKFISIVTCQS